MDACSVLLAIEMVAESPCSEKATLTSVSSATEVVMSVAVSETVSAWEFPL